MSFAVAIGDWHEEQRCGAIHVRRTVIAMCGETDIACPHIEGSH